MLLSAKGEKNKPFKAYAFKNLYFYPSFSV